MTANSRPSDNGKVAAQAQSGPPRLAANVQKLGRKKLAQIVAIHVCVCICMCMYVCMYIYIYIHMYVNLYAYVYM